jgi:hypothetical protein
LNVLKPGVQPQLNAAAFAQGHEQNWVMACHGMA